MSDAPARPALCQVVLDTPDPRRAAEFWRDLLDLAYRPGHEPPAPGEDDPCGRDWLNLETRDGQPVLAFQRVDAFTAPTWPSPAVPQQIHLDLTVPSVEALLAARDRVTAGGGRVLHDRSADREEPLYVFADPDGHPFCVFVVA